MFRIVDPEYWNRRVRTRKELLDLGFQTSATRFSLRASKNFNNQIASFSMRQKYIEGFGFAIPSREMLERTATLSKSLVEVGAGCGFIASQLARFGVETIATDPNETTGWAFRVGAHHVVERLNASDAILKYPDRDVLSSWPSYEENWLFEAVKLMRPGRLLFYIGEGYGGCTADDDFHAFVQNEVEFEEVEMIPMVQFYGINDNLWVYRRKHATAALA